MPVLIVANCRELHNHQRLAIARLLFQVRFNDVHFAILDEVRLLNLSCGTKTLCLKPQNWSGREGRAIVARFDSV